MHPETVRTRWQRPLLKRALAHKASLSFGCGLALVQTAIVIALPWPVKLAVDHVLARRPLPDWAQPMWGLGSSTTADMQLVVLAVATLALALISSAVSVSRAAWRRSLGLQLKYALGADMLEHVQRRSTLTGDRLRTGDVVQRVVADTACVETLVLGVWFTGFQSAVTFAFLAIVMLSVAPGVTAVGVAMAAAMAWTARRSGPRMARSAARLANAQSKVAATTTEMLGHLPEVQSFGAEAMESERFGADASDHLAAVVQAQRTMFAFNTGVAAITAVGTAAVMVFGGLGVLNGNGTVGDVLVAMAYLAALAGPAEGAAGLPQAFATARAGALRLLALTEAPIDVTDPREPVVPPPPRRGARVTFENVVFGYNDRRVLNGVSLDISPGETIAIVGPTGAGKSTLASMIPRFLDPSAGTVRLDGVDVRHWPLADLRKRIALVGQNSLILPISVRENIAYGAASIDEERVRCSAVDACADAFIERMPFGYDTVIGERGSTLSGGQRQRLAIARAIYRDAPVLLLDEPTSSLDMETEATLLDLLAVRAAGRTVIIVAHRFSAIREADRIAVVTHDGRLEVGTHAELLALGGTYATYYRLHAATV